MQITVLGATAPIGMHAVELALDHGHSVVALIRGGPNALPRSLKNHPNAWKSLKVIKGDATVLEDLKQAAEGSDAVLNCLGGKSSLKPTIASDSTKLLVSFLPETVMYVAVSNIGVGEESRQAQNYIIRRLLVDWYMPGILRDKLLAETTLQQSKIKKWVILRAGWLSNRPENLEKVEFVDVQNAKVTSRVSRLDIAAVAIKLVEGGYGDQYWGKTLNLVSG